MAKKKQLLHPDLFSDTPTRIVDAVRLGDFAGRKRELGYSVKWRPGRSCKHCIYRRHERFHGRWYNKCVLIGISNSEATDIRLYATCRLFHKKEDKQ